MLTKKYYKVLANTLNQIYHTTDKYLPPEAREEFNITIEFLIEYLKKDNPNFSITLFLQEVYKPNAVKKEKKL